MPLFGDYETVGEPVAITEERDHVSTVWQARKSGEDDSRQYAVKCFAPRRPKSTEDQAGDALDRDIALTYLESLKQLIKAHGVGGNFLVPILAFGVVPEGAWYATDFYPRSLKTWITLRGRVDTAALQHVVASIVTSCLALKRSRGCSHGNLKAGNVFLVGKPQALRTTPIHLADACAPELFQRSTLKGAPRAGAEIPLSDAVELHDLRGIGELVLQLVEGRLIASGYDYNYPIARSAAWDSLGRDGERWRDICNQLLDPQPSLDKINLETLGEKIKETARPNPVVANLPKILAAAGGLCLVAVIIYFIAREKVPAIAGQPQNLTLEVRSNATFTVAAVGRKMNYQWWKDGSGIAGMTNPSLEIPSVQTNDSGSYYVIVSNRAGAVTSKSARLTVVTTMLTVTAHNQQRFYGDRDPPLTGDVVGLRPGDGITVSYHQSADAHSPVGTYDIMPALDDPDGNLRNYLVTTNKGRLTINPAPLTVSAHDQKRAYGDPDPPLDGDAHGLLAGDDVTVTYRPSAEINSPAGKYDIMPVFRDPDGKLHNYALTINKGTLTVSPAPLTITVHDQKRVYGDPDPTLTGDLVGVRLGDNITVSYRALANSNSPVGSYAILPVFRDPDGRLRNYIVTTNKGAMNVTAAPLIVTAHDKERPYGTPNPPLAGELSGLRLGDDISATFHAPARNDSNVGNYDILPVFKDPAGRLSNYSVTTNKGSLSVTLAPLTVAAHDQKRVYGESNPRLTGEINGQRPGDNISATFDTAARSDAAVGDYDILPVFSDPEDRLRNYTVTTNRGTLSVTSAQLTVTAHDDTRAYGENNPALLGEVKGIRHGDDITAIFDTPARSDTTIGSYDILPVFLDSGNKLHNYTVITNKGTLTITLTRLTVTADNSRRTYGDNNPSFTGELSGLRPGDVIKPTFDTPARSDSAVGTYDITPTFKDPADKLRNYTVVIHKGTLTITPARLTVTAHDQKRPYAKSNPALTGDVKGLREVGGIKGFFGAAVRGDDITASYRTSADAGSAVGNYQISPVFNDPDNRLNNYTIITNLGTLTITPARLTVTPHDEKRAQGENNPLLTGDVNGLHPGDNILITYSTTADNNSPAGSYPIVPVFEDPNNRLLNYTVITNKGSLTITSHH